MRILYVFVFGLAVFAMSGFVNAAEEVQNEIQIRQEQIRALEEQIKVNEQELNERRQERRTLENEIGKFNAEIRGFELRIQSLNYQIAQADDEIVEITNLLSDLENEMNTHQLAIGSVLRNIDKTDQESLTNILLKNDNLSDFFTKLNDIQIVQQNLRLAMANIRITKTSLEQKSESLEDKKRDSAVLREIQAAEKSVLDSKKNEKDQILSVTKGEEDKFQSLINQTQADINKLKTQIQFLVEQGLSVEDAVRYAQLAAIGAGIRPAFLLGILEVETRLGRNQGSGNWRDDMYECYIRLGTVYYPHRKAYYLQRAETEKNAFFAIINKLGLNPDSVKVSAEPTYGCGGAMGPAQFIPSTWLGYEDDVARITGNNPPNPWSFKDAFTAAAIKLARGGASSQTRAGEVLASKRYICGGNTNQPICSHYANLVQTKAAELANSLPSN